MNQHRQWFTKIVYTEKQITKKCQQLAAWVDETYQESHQLVLVAILKGSLPFLAELMKHIQTLHTLDFMTISTFDGGLKSSGNVKLVMDLKHNIKGKDVLIVEDVVDSGITLAWVMKQLKARQPKSLKVLTLLDKRHGRSLKINVDQVGFKAPDEFLVGFGLDMKGKLRNIPFIGVFDQSKIDDL